MPKKKTKRLELKVTAVKSTKDGVLVSYSEGEVLLDADTKVKVGSKIQVDLDSKGRGKFKGEVVASGAQSSRSEDY